jgi:hypothetical protein
VLVNHVRALGQLGLPSARKRLAQKQGCLLAHSLREREGNDRGVVLDSGAPGWTVRLTGFLAAPLHLSIKPSVHIPATPNLVLGLERRPKWLRKTAGVTSGAELPLPARAARTRQAAVNHFIRDHAL